MNKPCYTDYIKHAMRFYSRYSYKQHFKNKVDESNWKACHEVIQTYSDRDRDILVYVYGSYDTISDNVYAMSEKYQMHQNVIWDLMREFEQKVAIERGLWV